MFIHKLRNFLPLHRWLLFDRVEGLVDGEGGHDMGRGRRVGRGELARREAHILGSMI